MRILHVTECYAGGVSRALNSMVDNSSSHEHVLLWQGNGDPGASGRFTSTERLPAGLAARIAAVGDATKKYQPNVIWAHSSWAGVYVRALRRGVPVVYQPHCFVFTDPSRAMVMRGAYWLAESLLARRSSRIVALTSAEARTAHRLSRHCSVHRVCNVSTLVSQVRGESRGSHGPKEVVMVGRVCPQKDPSFFATVAKLASESGSDLRFTWVGAGDRRLMDELISAGVDVTGWLQKEELTERLLSSSLYFHSASYEGFPLSVIEAAALGLPIITRDIACFEEYSIAKVDDAASALDSIEAVFTNPSTYAEIAGASREMIREMTPENQAKQLRDLLLEVGGHE